MENAKIMEKSMCARLNSSIEKCELLYTGPFGFRSGHATEMTPVNTQDLITEAIDTNKHFHSFIYSFIRPFL